MSKPDQAAETISVRNEDQESTKRDALSVRSRNRSHLAVSSKKSEANLSTGDQLRRRDMMSNIAVKNKSVRIKLSEYKSTKALSVKSLSKNASNLSVKSQRRSKNDSVFRSMGQSREHSRKSRDEAEPGSAKKVNPGFNYASKKNHFDEKSFRGNEYDSQSYLSHLHLPRTERKNFSNSTRNKMRENPENSRRRFVGQRNKSVNLTSSSSKATPFTIKKKFSIYSLADKK